MIALIMEMITVPPSAWSKNDFDLSFRKISAASCSFATDVFYDTDWLRFIAESPLPVRPLFAYNGAMQLGTVTPDSESRPLDRYVFAVALIPGVFVSVRLARLPDRELNEGRLDSAVRQGVLLARNVLAEATRG